MTQPTVRVGQVWMDADKRQEGKRLLKVVQLEEDSVRVWRPSVMRYEVVSTIYAVCRRLSSGGEPDGPSRRVRVDRFKPTSTGYKLVTDVPAEVAREG